jgi:glucose/arabinose dehydrogenase
VRRLIILTVIPFVLAGCFQVQVAGPAEVPESPPPSPALSPSPAASPALSPSPAETPPDGSPSPGPPSSPPPLTGQASPVAPEPTGSPDETGEPIAAPPVSSLGSPPADPPASPGSERGFAPAETRLRVERIAEGFDSPVYVTGDGTGRGRLYIVERAGTIRIWEKGSILPEPLIDLRSQVSTEGERGLHAVAFHPRFERNNRFFVHFNDARGRTRISEFRARGDSPAQIRTGRDIMRVPQPETNHNGGWIGFGPDGYLYIALGDGGGESPGDPQGRGQRRDSLLAKILRIDVDSGERYGVPEDNPFVDRRRFAPETWAWGLRNPWRASFDRETGDLWIGDVGQDQFEEVNRVPAGEAGYNFGWSDMEGAECYLKADCDPSDYRDPVWTYEHGDECAIVGGYVYRGERYPLLQGAYLFADYCSGTIWALDADAVADGREAPARRLLDTPRDWVSFGEDDDGELYAVSLGGGLHRIRAPAAD